MIMEINCLIVLRDAVGRSFNILSAFPIVRMLVIVLPELSPSRMAVSILSICVAL